MQGIQKAHQVTAGRSQARPSRDVCDRNDFDPVGDTDMPQSFARQSVFDLIDMVNHLGLGVSHTDFIVNDRRVDVQEHVFVNRGSEYESAVLAVERRKISTPAPQRQSKWSSCDDHWPLMACNLRMVISSTPEDMHCCSRQLSSAGQAGRYAL